jgi:tetratricopeptide (TPR) repeat protein
LSGVTRWSLRVYGYYYGRQFDQLIEQARLDGDYYLLGMGYLRMGLFEQGLEAFTTCCEDDTLLFANFYAMSGEREEALRLLGEIEGTVEESVETGWRVRSQHGRFGLAYTVAVTYAALGQTDRAFIWLDRAREVIPWGLGMSLPDPALDSLRSEPRFQALAAEMGLDPWGRVLK